MNLRRNCLHTLASVVFVALPAAHGVAIDLNQHGLTGAWYEPRTSGQGFAMEVFPDLLSRGTGIVQMSWFTYDDVAGGAERQRWYTLSGSVVSGQPSAALTIYRNIGGNFNAPPLTSAQPVGTATLSFDSCTSGQLIYDFTDGSGRASIIPLTRLMADAICGANGAFLSNPFFGYSGNWYDAATSGQGLTVEVNTASNVVFFAWQTYAPNGVGAGPAGQRWYTGQGTLGGEGGALAGDSMPVQLYESTGGLFDEGMPAAPTTAVVGNGILTFESCSSAKLSFDFTGGSSSGMSGTIALGRIGPVPYPCGGAWDYY
jgi:hypothetical protein